MATSSKEVVPDAVRMQEAKDLRRLIAEREISQAALASQAGVGTKPVITQILKGTRPLNLKAAYMIAEVLKVKLDDFTPRLAALVRQALPYISVETLSPADQPAPSAGGERAREARPLYAATPWPLPSVSPAEFARISPEARRELDAIARGMSIQSQAAAS